MAEGFSFDNLYVAAVGRWVINKKKLRGMKKGAKEQRNSKYAHAEQLKSFTRPEKVNGRTVSIWERHWNLTVSIG